MYVTITEIEILEHGIRKPMKSLRSVTPSKSHMGEFGKAK